MRIVVLMLLLANVALLAWLDYDAQRTRDESKALAQQVRPERIRLMSPQEVAALQPGAGACLEIGPLAAADAARARESFSALRPAPATRERQEGDAVYVQLRQLSAATRAEVEEIREALGGAPLRACPPAG